jgi:hypothetical protein
MLASGGSGHATPRLIGLPLSTTQPNIKGIRWRFCSRWDEQPAAQLGKSLLRLGICRVEDWSGSAVDFVEHGFRRFAKANGADQAKKVWSGELRIADDLFEQSELERNQRESETTCPTSLYLVGEYHESASIPIRATLLHLAKADALLPAAFYKILVHNLRKWMRVYDYSDAVEHSELWLSELDEDSDEKALYTKVQENVPQCLASQARLSERKARAFLQEIERSLRDSVSRRLVQGLLELDNEGRRRKHAWPEKLANEVPGVQDWLDGCDGCGPGCLITWHAGDEINACFDEDMHCIGQDGPLEPPIVLLMPLGRSEKEFDGAVKEAMEYGSAMLRSLATAARIVETIREIDDEHIRQHRLQSGLQAEPGPTGLRDEQL